MLAAVAVRRGMGQQGKLGLYNFLGFWGFGVIVGYVLCFHVGWGLKGLWSGIVAGVFLTRYPALTPTSYIMMVSVGLKAHWILNAARRSCLLG